MSISTIKAAIKTNLDNLVTDTTLAGADSSDIKTDPLQADVGVYPYAFLMPPSTDSEVLDNRSVLRTHTFDILIIFQAEDITGVAEVETTIEACMAEFDNDPTLSGTALGGVLPVSSSPTPYQQ